MTNRIVIIDIQTHRLTPFEAELWVRVQAERTTATTELRGRFVGPKCAVSSTIEVAYPLQRFARRPAELNGLAAHVVIPEPSLWEPECPFVYDGLVELWENGERCDVRHVPGYKLLTVNSTSLWSP